MNDMPKAAAEPDYSATLFLPETNFPMRAGLPEREPVLAEALGGHGHLRPAARRRRQGKPLFTLHDGPPYANGNIHIGHALNKILKDLVSRSKNMLGYNSAYVPGWDCHGLPIEWKIEEQYRAKGKDKNDVADQRIPRRVPHLCAVLGRHPARGVQAARRHRRLGQPLSDDELRRRSADRARADEGRGDAASSIAAPSR